MLKRKRAKNPYYNGPKSDHFDGRVFFNPQGEQPKGLANFIKWKFMERQAKWPECYASEYDCTIPQQRIAGNALEVTLIGHATFLIQINGLNIVTDPVWSQRVSPLSFIGPKRVNPPGVKFNDLPNIDVVLLTHNHYDHLDIVTLGKLVKRDNPTIITPLGNDTIVKQTIANANVITGDWGDVLSISNNTKIHIEPCHHWSARNATDRRMALWAAFVIEAPDMKVYHIGDTGFHLGTNYKDIEVKHGQLDLAIIPIGAYAPRWFLKAQHQDPDEAVDGFKLCKAKHALGHHWGTFQLTNEPIEEPKHALKMALGKKGVIEDRFLAMTPGQVWRF